MTLYDKLIEAAYHTLRDTPVPMHTSSQEDDRICSSAIVDSVLELLSHPTEEMIEAGTREPCEHAWSVKGESISDPQVIWQAMLQKAKE